jgi:hypothetical protein
VYACNPLSYHAGFYGLNRKGKSLTGSLNEQAEQIKNMAEDEMNARADLYKDIRQCNLNQKCVLPLSVYGPPEDLPIDVTPPQVAGYDPVWLKRGIKVRSK